MPEFGDQRPQRKADGDKDDGNEHHGANAESICPISDDGCQDAGYECEGEG